MHYRKVVILGTFALIVSDCSYFCNSCALDFVNICFVFFHREEVIDDAKDTYAIEQLVDQVHSDLASAVKGTSLYILIIIPSNSMLVFMNVFFMDFVELKN